MPKTIISYISVFLALVVCQAVIFNNLILFNSAVALVFLYFIVELPITLNVNYVMSLAFLIGLSVDIFQDTPGLNCLSCTIVSFLRRPIFYLYAPRDEDFAGKRLCLSSLGTSTFLKYMLSLVLLYCIIYFSCEALAYGDILRMIIRIVSSTAYTFIVLFTIDSLTLYRHEKRL